MRCCGATVHEVLQYCGAAKLEPRVAIMDRRWQCCGVVVHEVLQHDGVGVAVHEVLRHGGP